MVVGDAPVFPGFPTPVVTQLFFPKPPTTFLTYSCRGERGKYAGKKVRLNRELSKLKAFADHKINVTQKLKIMLGWVENIVGKGENAGCQHFLLFPECFQKASYTGSLKVGIVW